MTARLAPIPDSLRFGQSNGAQMLEALRGKAAWLDTVRRFPRKWLITRYGSLPEYESQCIAVRVRLREQGNYLIQAGVR